MERAPEAAGKSSIGVHQTIIHHMEPGRSSRNDPLRSEHEEWILADDPGAGSIPALRKPTSRRNETQRWIHGTVSRFYSSPSSHCLMRPFGSAPTFVAAGAPPLKRIIVGMPRTP